MNDLIGEDNAHLVGVRHCNDQATLEDVAREYHAYRHKYLLRDFVERQRKLGIELRRDTQARHTAVLSEVYDHLLDPDNTDHDAYKAMLAIGEEYKRKITEFLDESRTLIGKERLRYSMNPVIVRHIEFLMRKVDNEGMSIVLLEHASMCGMCNNAIHKTGLRTRDGILLHLQC